MDLKKLEQKSAELYKFLKLLITMRLVSFFSLYTTLATRYELCMFDNVFSWSIFIIFLFIGIYTARIIKGEKEDALASAVELVFHGLSFQIPRWWTKTLDNGYEITFERTDTRYDWKATFLLLREYDADIDLQSIYEEQALKRGLVFDKDTSIIHSPSELNELYDQGLEALRVEGTATENSEKRLYYDAIIIRNSNDQFIFLESKASVLNGLLEGPFFEQMLKHIKIYSS